MRAELRMDWRGPGLLVAPERAHAVLRVDVGLVIGEQQEGIVIEEILDDRAEEFGVAVAERAAGDEVDDFAQRLVLLVVIARAIAARFHLARPRRR